MSVCSVTTIKFHHLAKMLSAFIYLLHYILIIWIWPVGALCAGSCVLFTCFFHSLRTSFLVQKGCSRPMLYFPYSTPRVCFSNKPWFLLVGTAIQEPRSQVCLLMLLLLGPLNKQNQEIYIFHLQTHKSVFPCQSMDILKTMSLQWYLRFQYPQYIYLCAQYSCKYSVSLLFKNRFVEM